MAPSATLFSGALPRGLQGAGGWASRDTAAGFGEYADRRAAALGDRVKLWITLNEPFIHLSLGHLLGVHAPGIAGTVDLLSVTHHQLLGHGLAVAAIRDQPNTRVGIANNYTPVWAVGTDGTPGSATEDDRVAAFVYDVMHNRVFTDPLLLGRYPDGIEALSSGDVDAVVLDGDLEVIAAPLDVLGVNYYSPTGIGWATSSEGAFAASPVPFELRPLAGFARTDLDWPAVPDGLRDLMERTARGRRRRGRLWRSGRCGCGPAGWRCWCWPTSACGWRSSRRSRCCCPSRSRRSTRRTRRPCWAGSPGSAPRRPWWSTRWRARCRTARRCASAGGASGAGACGRRGGGGSGGWARSGA